MIDPTEEELKAMETAEERAGEFLDGFGKTDLAYFTAEEWKSFIRTVCTGFTEGLINLPSSGAEEIPS